MVLEEQNVELAKNDLFGSVAIVLKVFLIKNIKNTKYIKLQKNSLFLEMYKIRNKSHLYPSNTFSMPIHRQTHTHVCVHYTEYWVAVLCIIYHTISK